MGLLKKNYEITVCLGVVGVLPVDFAGVFFVFFAGESICSAGSVISSTDRFRVFLGNVKQKFGISSIESFKSSLAEFSGTPLAALDFLPLVFVRGGLKSVTSFSVTGFKDDFGTTGAASGASLSESVPLFLRILDERRTDGSGVLKF